MQWRGPTNLAVTHFLKKKNVQYWIVINFAQICLNEIMHTHSEPIGKHFSTPENK